MSTDGLVVSAPARLHFGLLRFSNPSGLSFGGLGMMVRDPRTVVRLSRSHNWQFTGPSANLALAAARHAVTAAEAAGSECFSIEIAQAPPRHRGFGSGTQLALTLTAGVLRLMGREWEDATTLAAAANRARRSAIGTHGFLHGGLLWERGRAPEQSISPLETRVLVPEAWRVLLLQPLSREGTHGPAEAAVFEQLPPVPADVTERLKHLAAQEILPAAVAGDFARFTSHLEAYGEAAGNCFSSVQGGPFANQRVADVVAAARAAGALGVGQTSWGPTVFAFAEDQGAAEAIAEQLTSQTTDRSFAISITRPDNHGATFSLHDLPSRNRT
ncbi:MAG: hypothetical protein AAGA92_08515 [Planctomycetota bacterium]